MFFMTGRNARPATMVQPGRVPHVLHRHVCWPGQCVAFSLHRLRKRWWRLSHSLHHRPADCGQALLLHGARPRPVLQRRTSQGVGGRPSTQGWVLHYIFPLQYDSIDFWQFKLEELLFLQRVRFKSLRRFREYCCQMRVTISTGSGDL